MARLIKARGRIGQIPVSEDILAENSKKKISLSLKGDTITSEENKGLRQAHCLKSSTSRIL